MVRWALVAIVILAVPALSQRGDSDLQKYRPERKQVEKFIDEHFSKGKLPPFSFLYDGRPSSAFIGEWRFAEEGKIVSGTQTDYTYTYADPRSGLLLSCLLTTFSDFPAVEWVLKLKNPSAQDTPLIDNIRALDAGVIEGGEGSYILHRAKGSDAARDDFAPIDQPLNPDAEISFGPDAGRSSDAAALPFFNVETPGKGVVAGIGWSGKWKASVRRDGNRAITISAGMEKTHLKLFPGEEIRTPRVLLLYWQGEDRMAGNNLFRRFILKHHTQQAVGKPVTLPLAHGIGFGGPRPCVEYCCATETYAVAMANRLDQFGLKVEVGWIDAGWYEGNEQGWWQGVGNWFPSKKNFPRGLRPVSDALKQLGMGFLLWFEPERVYEGTWLDREHAEWLIGLPGRVNRLLNLGNADARRWLTDHISGMLEKEGISLYRQDFNFDPLPYWRAADDPDRIGMTEIRHIEGLYAFWDSLLARHPGLVIDNCASGGRRIDLETVSRSSPLWRTDYSYFEPNGYQCHTYGLSFFLPLSGTGNNNPDPYYFRSSSGSALVLGWEINQNTFPLEIARKSIEEFKRLRPYFYGDYYPLTDYSTSDAAWMAYQYDRPESSDGIVLAFRRNLAPEETIKVRLHGLTSDMSYRVTFEDYGITLVRTGRELLGGMDVKIPRAPGSLLITYVSLKK